MMNATAQKIARGNDVAALVIERVLAQAPDAVWQQLTTGAAMARWIMAPAGFVPRVGQRFTFQTRPAGAWDGVIQCEVLDVVPQSRLAYSWRSGDDGNIGYGAPLDSVVTFELEPAAAGGTLLRLIHAGFVLPRNETARRSMGDGWPTCIAKLSTVADA